MTKYDLEEALNNQKAKNQADFQETVTHSEMANVSRNSFSESRRSLKTSRWPWKTCRISTWAKHESLTRNSQILVSFLIELKCLENFATQYCKNSFLYRLLSNTNLKNHRQKKSKFNGTSFLWDILCILFRWNGFEKKNDYDFCGRFSCNPTSFPVCTK